MPVTRDVHRFTRPLPVVEEPLPGVTYFWLDGGFRRATLLEQGGGAYLLSIDLYARRGAPEGSALSVEGARLIRRRVSCRDFGVEGEWCELLYSEAGGRAELIGFRVLLRSKPSRDEVRGIYRRVVLAVEGRDPERAPLRAPTCED